MFNELNLNTIDIIIISAVIITIINMILTRKTNNKTIKITIDKSVIKKEINKTISKSNIFEKEISKIIKYAYEKDYKKLEKNVQKIVLEKIKNNKNKNEDLIEKRSLIEVNNITIKETDKNKFIVDFSSLQTVHFIDSTGKLIKGNKNKIIKVSDSWEFIKDKKSNLLLNNVLKKI